MRLAIELDFSSADAELREAYEAEGDELLRGVLRSRRGVLDLGRIVSRPSFGFRWSGEGGATERAAVERELPALYLAVEPEDPDEDLAFLNRLRDAGLRVRPDAPVDSFDSWCPAGDAPPIFHARPAADGLIRAEALRQAGLRGEGVNLVLVDEGISKASLAARYPDLPGTVGAPRFVGGWDVKERGQPWRKAGFGLPDGHGTMVALNALSLAPDARVFDLPLLPDRINDVRRYTVLIAAALAWVQAEIIVRLGGMFPGPWVFSHAWGIYDRRFERPWGGYTEDPSHPLNEWVRTYDTTLGHDQVFAAGNCGQFCPNGRCGPDDQGPGVSILGANASPHVLTMGAVRADGLWIGYSSQGPGQAEFLKMPVGTPDERRKPDLCAPSHFVEPADGRFLSSGTSAACGLAAGAVAALRGTGSPAHGLPTGALRGLLRETAQAPPGLPGGYDIRHGAGILDLEAALALNAASMSGNPPGATAPVEDGGQSRVGSVPADHSPPA